MARIRSPNYPAISLPEAIERVRKIYGKEGNHKAAPEVVAKAMGYGGLNGGSLSAISALKKYGLLEEIGKDLRVSTDALTILVDQKDSPERTTAITKAALLPVLFSELQKQYGNTLPSDENLRSFLLKRGFAQGAVDLPIRAYRETIKFVTEEGRAYNESSIGLDDQQMDAGHEQPQNPLPPSRMPTGIQRAKTVLVPSSDSGVEVGSFPVAKNSMVRLIATSPLTEEAVKALIKQLQLGVDLGLFPNEIPTVDE